jgi:prepilin-type processing-associated H-X9-DG protein
MRHLATITLAVALIAAWAGAAVAQGPAAATPAAPAPDAAAGDPLAELLEAGNMPPEAQMLFKMLTSGEDVDPLVMMLLMSAMDGGNMDDDALLFGLMMRNQGQVAPVVVQGDGYLLVVEKGRVYKINTQTLALEGQVTYRGVGNQGAAMMQAMGPMLDEARAKALMTASMSNEKQLALGFLMYAQDFDEVLPGGNWVDDLKPYLKNEEIYRNPAQLDASLGYAMNAKLAGMALADVPDPSQTVLLFEAAGAENKPLGDFGDVLATHPGNMCVVAFVDGHVQAVPYEQAVELLQQQDQ